MTHVKFNATKSERPIIERIARRAYHLAKKLKGQYPLLEAEMDVTATHCNGNELRLRELVEADDFNFGHDVFGIRRYLDRETGQLTDHFRPRFSAPRPKGEAA